MSDFFGWDEGYDGDALAEIGSVEANFATAPLVVATKNTVCWEWNGRAYRREVEWEMPGGGRVVGSISVVPSPIGPPGHFDFDVLIALQQIAIEDSTMAEDGRLTFSLRQVAERIGISPAGKNLGRVSEAITRWTKTYFEFDRVFWSASARRATTASLHFIRAYEDASEGAQGHPGRARAHTVVFDPVVVDSIRNGYVCTLDLSAMWSLNNPLSRAIWRQIALNHRGGVYEVALTELHDRLGLGCEAVPWRIKKTLGRPHAHLAASGRISTIEYSRRGVVRYVLSEEYAEVERMAISGLKTIGEARTAIRLRRACKIRKDEAIATVATHGREKVEAALAALAAASSVNSPAGWVKWALSDPGNLARVAPEPEADPEPPVEEPGQRGAAEDRAAADLFERLLDAIAEATPGAPRWFNGVVPASLTASTLTLRVPNEIARDHITSRFLDDLRTAMADEVGPGATVELTV